MVNKALNSALRKTQYNNPNKKYCGCFTPHEIVALINAGVKHSLLEWEIDILKQDIKNGQCNPRWFYFFPGRLKMPDSIDKQYRCQKDK